ncbi:hypothetical protein H2199_002092 [Coniosporium tulheliwenetii]|uniref:Uncharacterized protein n=1 Tax=Coniosporium tulheliwenetii TaxID=3383036 RepID=A0ACC2ZHU3_9PEZI|nr:hypothetical protein H2199_002092 [Cladosporium sp. JES 115]
MNGTPRLRSAFPSTPQNFKLKQDGTPRRDPGAGSPLGASLGSPLPEMPSMTSSSISEPLIPFETLDAPSQRFYVAAFYFALMGWRLYDWWTLNQEDTESLWLFMKWILIDGVFLFGLPSLRIPWLEWSSFVIITLFLVHAIVDGMLMFRLFPHYSIWFAGFFKLFSSSEYAINERSVNPAKIYNNASLILGRQIINILPEGSAMLNPERQHFCLDDASRHQVQIPIQINQTTPILIELLRVDLDKAENETISISSSKIRSMVKEARKTHKSSDPASPLLLHYMAKKPGLYVLQKVVDESKLEVATRPSDAMIVSCPSASVRPSGINRCRGELSDVALQVKGTPPLRIKYRKVINGVEREASFQSIQPDDFVSPLKQQPSLAMVRSGKLDVKWAASQEIVVPLNETLTTSGTWTYTVDEVQDALGNVVSYAAREDEGGRHKHKGVNLHQALTVHERPLIFLRGCDTQHPLRVAKGQSTALPVSYGSTGKQGSIALPHTIEYLFTPDEALSATGEHSEKPHIHSLTVKNTNQRPSIHESGLYTLKSVSTEFCKGEVMEPASCLLQNPPEPDISILKTEISDKCAGRKIGLRMELHLTGTPPFEIQFIEQKDAGKYTYTFTEINDAVYKGRSLKEKGLVYEQDVKPSASAHFVDVRPKREACIEEPVSFDVRLQGEGPWILEYEIVHAGKRTKHQVKEIQNERYTITTEKLKSGGEYTIALSSVTDKSKCKEFLKAEATINVRHERPKAYFSSIESKRSVRTLEGKRVQLPVRLTGKGPWTLSYRDASGNDHTVNVQRANDFLDVTQKGTYQLLSVHDAICPGSIDESAKIFEVSWVPRPEIVLPESPTVKRAEGSLKGHYVKQDVCEGDEDTFDVSFSGTPPFDVKYEQHIHPDHGLKSLSRKELNAALGVASIRMDTAQPGLYEYKFTEISDYNYDHNPKLHQPLTLKQRVNPRPTARFKDEGKTYNFCSSDLDSDQEIPVLLTGHPPFTLEITIKQHGSLKPTTKTFSNIPSTTYSLRIPRSKLLLGRSQISILTVRDSLGCLRKTDPATSSKVQASVFDPPSISAVEPHKSDYCVAPFSVTYTFNGATKRASAPSTSFRRLAESPGIFAITGLSDSASQCRFAPSTADIAGLTKRIHALPSVRISKGRETITDIHEGGEAELLFEFTGSPPFEFVVQRSENMRRGHKAKVLETKSLVSEEFELRIMASQEGVYEVVSIRDRWCAFSKVGGPGGVQGQKLLQ